MGGKERATVEARDKERLMPKPVYRMSQVGACPRILAAKRLGYEPTPISPEELDQLNHYSRLEAIARQQIMELGYWVEPSLKCQACDRQGIHVEIDLPLYLLVGHLDGRLVIKGTKYPIEIKSLGKSSWLKFQKEQFNGFGGYAGQECVYLQAEGRPGVYWVMERDSGRALKYIVNDADHNLGLPGFERITLPITFDQLEDKLNLVEIAVQDGQLPESEESDDCWFCRYSYLCPRGGKDTKIETLPSLIEAANLYREGRGYEVLAKEAKEKATSVFLAHSKSNAVDKFSVSGISFSYRGQKVKEYLDTASLKRDDMETYLKYLKKSNPYDDFSIRVLGEK